MSTVKMNFDQILGAVKPMHSVNNGPVGSRVRKGMSNFYAFREAGIPYARTHDASFCTSYGGEHTVDVHRIYKNFDADETDPASYDFEVTDMYMEDILSVGTKPFFRLGASIEHGKKVGTYPPKDFHKWARICEHIIWHYTEELKMDIEYWEIWNEPDCTNPDGSNPCWQGTLQQFCDFFVVVYSHLKEKFPHLKIGGPAFCSVSRPEEKAPFFEALLKNDLALDFFSFHAYSKTPKQLGEKIDKARNLLTAYGMDDTELILNEWNYIKGWIGDDWIYTIRSEKGLKGASFVAGCMCIGQAKRLDNLMYYDARPCPMNGMFDTTFYTPLKGYYPFKMFNTLYQLGSIAQCQSDDDTVYAAAATDGEKCAVMVTYFEDEDEAPVKSVTLDLGKPGMAAIYLLDENHDMAQLAKVKTNGSMTLDMTLFATYLVVLE